MRNTVAPRRRPETKARTSKGVASAICHGAGSGAHARSAAGADHEENAGEQHGREQRRRQRRMPPLMSPKPVHGPPTFARCCRRTLARRRNRTVRRATAGGCRTDLRGNSRRCDGGHIATGRVLLHIRVAAGILRTRGDMARRRRGRYQPRKGLPCTRIFGPSPSSPSPPASRSRKAAPFRPPISPSGTRGRHRSRRRPPRTRYPKSARTRSRARSKATLPRSAPRPQSDPERIQPPRARRRLGRAGGDRDVAGGADEFRV